MAKKPKTPESPPFESEAVKTAKKAREGIDILAALGEFEKSPAGKEILKMYDLKNIAEVFEDEDVFNAIVSEINALQEKIDPIHFQAFLVIAVEKYPHVISESIAKYSQFQINDPETLRMVLQILEEKAYEVSPEMLKETEEEDESEPFTGLELELSEDVISSERHLLISEGQISNLPPEVADIVSGHASFRNAMEDDEAFEKLLERLRTLKEKLEPELYSEMLVITAEMSDEVDQFLKDYGAVSFRQAMGSHRLFLELMKGWWFKWLNESLNQPQIMQELLIAAAKASKENAEWFLKKAMSDEKGEKMPDEKDEKIPDEDEYYNLQEEIGDEAFEAVMSAARQMVK